MRHHTTQPRRIGGLAIRVLLALAVAALPGCRGENPTGPEEPAAQAARTDPLAADLTVDQSAASGAAAGSLGVTATRLPKSFFVNPSSGKDTNSGTKLLPFKTLARALTSTIARDTVRLASGVYSAATNGERFTNAIQQVRVPAGVMILGTPVEGCSGRCTTTQLSGGAGDFVGLNLQGAATVKNLDVTGFGKGIQATQGVQVLKNVTLDQNQTGLNLFGSAKATLVGSRVFLTPPLVPAGTIVGARIAQQAQLTVVGGTINGAGQNCRKDVQAVLLAGAARLTMKNGATLKDIAGRALVMSGTSKAMLTGLTTIDRNFSQVAGGCTPSPSVLTLDSASLTLRKARIFSTGGTNSIGIQPESRALLTLDSAQVTGHTGAGIQSFASPRIVATGSLFKGNTVGIDAPLNVTMTITGSTVTNSVIGIRAPFFKLRGSNVASNQIGILMTSPFTDLGQTTDPGKNLIINNSNTGVTFSQEVINGKVGGIFGSGNIWNAFTQGSDANGKYPPQVLNGSSPMASGTNFKLPGFNFAIEF